MGLFDTKEDTKSDLYGDLLGPSRPFDAVDKALDPERADAMDRINRFQAGHYDHGLTYTETLTAGDSTNLTALYLSDPFDEIGKTKGPFDF